MMPGSVLQRDAGREVAAGLLVERRCAGELFPRVPVGSLELTREQVAGGLHLMRVALSSRSTVRDFVTVVGRAVEVWGLEALNQRAEELAGLPGTDYGARVAWARAWRTCVAHWYVGALSEPLSQEERAVALYASGLTRSRGLLVDERLPQVYEGIYEGAARLGAETVARLAREARKELGSASVAFERLGEEYREAMPHGPRRRYCYHVAVNMSVPAPLLVRLESGRYAIGATPPPCPVYTAHLSTMWPDGSLARVMSELLDQATAAVGGAR